jgi:SAM-dependent methyltransferase
MYSADWFSTFSATIPADVVDREVEALVGLFPAPEYRRLLDVGCGIGRVAGPLATRGYSVTGIDISLTALRQARREAPGPNYVALDQRYVGEFGWRFDAAFILWNSIGFVSREVDRAILSGLHRVLRPDALLALDMYHPDWLIRNVDRPSPHQGGRDVATHRWLRDGRLHNRIEYSRERADHIEFEVYRPEEIEGVATTAGFETMLEMVWWDPSVPPSPDHARYQILFRRAASSRKAYAS